MIPAGTIVKAKSAFVDQSGMEGPYVVIGKRGYEQQLVSLKRPGEQRVSVPWHWLEPMHGQAIVMDGRMEHVQEWAP